MLVRLPFAFPKDDYIIVRGDIIGAVGRGPAREVLLWIALVEAIWGERNAPN